jgi:hypothetical protein
MISSPGRAKWVQAASGHKEVPLCVDLGRENQVGAIVGVGLGTRFGGLRAPGAVDGSTDRRMDKADRAADAVVDGAIMCPEP